MIYHDDLNKYAIDIREKLSGIKPSPLRIRFQFLTPPAGYGDYYLDGLLAKAVVNMATEGRGLPKSNEPYWIPLPLQMIDTCPESGLPLWAANPLKACDIDIVEPDIWHKRKVRSERLKKNPKSGKVEMIRGTAGQHKELQIPLPLHSCLKWEATCCGNSEMIKETFKYLPNAGKKTRPGHGIILNIEIEPIDKFKFAENRPLPLWYIRQSDDNPMPQGTFATMGWTPPYWFPPCQTMCRI